MNCKNCKTFYCPEHGFNFEKQCNRYTQPTNADRIRAMTDEELAEWATTVGRTFGEEYEGYMSALDWLKKEATE